MNFSTSASLELPSVSSQSSVPAHTQPKHPQNEQQRQHTRSASISHQKQPHPSTPVQPQVSPRLERSSQIRSDGGTVAPQQQILQSPVTGHFAHQPTQGIQYLDGHYQQQAGPFPVTEDGRILMATAHMQQRPYSNVYNPPQSHSPVPASSPHDAQSRAAMFAQPHNHMASSIYTSYPPYQTMSQVQQPSYAHSAQTQAPTSMASQSLLMSHQQSAPQLQHSSHTQSPSSLPQQSPRPKLEPSAMPLHRSLDASAIAQSPQQRLHNGMQGPPSSSGGLQQSPRSGGSTTSNAAPGPIPATTPILVRTDNNGNSWIAFEYSRDRVKMEYTISCSVENVDVAKLDEKFRDENCVYPRAMGPRDEYKGNRYNYETECNNVGWALASLNPCIRGKRGLIQRAVDSWRNSNADTKLRSRRVRRQQKVQMRGKANDEKQALGSLGSQGTLQRPGSMPDSMPGLGPDNASHSHHVPGSGADDGSNAGRFAMRAPRAYAPTMNMTMSHMGASMGSHMGGPAGQVSLPQQRPQPHQGQQISSSSMNYPSQLTAVNMPYGQMSGQPVHYYSGGQS